MEEEDSKAEWNIDDAVLKAIFMLKVQFLGYMRVWDLENAYWTLILMDSEVTPSLAEAKQKTIKTKLIELEKTRKTHLTNHSETNMSKFWSDLNFLYKEMNGDMINEGYYFRKKELYRGL